MPMKLSPTIQDALLALMMYDDEGGNVIRASVPSTAFSDYYSDVAASLLDYWKKYNKPPQEHAVDLFNDLLSKKRSAKEALRSIKSAVESLKGKVNRDYVISQAQVFCRWATLNKSVGQVLDILEKPDPVEADIEKAENLLFENKATAITLSDPGINLSNPAQALRFMFDEESDEFSTGVAVLDKAGICPTRKKLYTLMSDSGQGKSQHCAGIAFSSAVVKRANVLLVSLEMNENDYAKRLMQTMFGLTTDDEVQHFIKFQRDEQGMVVGFKQRKVKNSVKFSDANAFDYLQKEINKLRPSIRVKDFPTGSLTIEKLNEYITSLEWQHNYIPDMLIIDYPDLMHYDPGNERAEIASIYRRFRGMADARSFAAVAVTQANRSGETAKVKTAQHTGHALEKYQISDFYVTYNQTDIERTRGLARLFVSKGRSRKDKFTVIISQMYGLGRFCVDSVRMPESAYNQMLSAEHQDD